ncbi:MAG: hypothetical protein CMM93_05990 [Rickettsiales bacterium]|nr:hypothetical protein [Rickettsiales bacterium]
MIKNIRSGTLEDFKLVSEKTLATKYIKERIHEAGTIEMFELLVQKMNGGLNYQMILQLIDNNRYDLLKHIIADDRISDVFWQKHVDEYLLDVCLPESADLLRLRGDMVDFAHQVIDENHLQPKHLTHLLGINEEVYLKGLQTIQGEIDYPQINRISSDCIKYLDRDRIKQIRRQIIVIVRNIKDIECDLSFINVLNLQFETTEIPPKELLESINMIYIINPYFVVEYEPPHDVQCDWIDGDLRFLKEHINKIKYPSLVKLIKPNRKDYTQIIQYIHRIANGRFKEGVADEIEDLDENLTEEMMRYIIGTQKFLWSFGFALIHHKRILFGITNHQSHFSQLDFKSCFRFVNWNKIGNYLQYIPFTQRMMEKIIKLNPNLYIFKNSCIKCKKITSKSARF